MNTTKILFAIHSCGKNVDRAEFLYRLLENKLGQTVEICIFFENSGEQPIHTVCNFRILNKKNDIFDLASQSYNGIINCDDNIFPNIYQLKQFIHRVSTQDKIQYAGNISDISPIYYLGKQALSNHGNHKYELVHVPLYSNEQNLFFAFSIRNNIFRIPYAFARIHGGLGNQLFQCAAAVGVAMTTHRLPVLVFTESPAHYQHNASLFEYINTVFKNVCCISYEHSKHMLEDRSKCFHWSEVHSGVLPNACFTYQTDIINALMGKDVHLFLNGYFQNEKYFKEVKQIMIDHFYDSKRVAEISAKYPRVAESYFIHVRRGDYVGNPLYNINYDGYLKKALDYITKTEMSHFYIVTNDIDYCRKHPEFGRTGVEFTILDDASFSTLDTLYFMAACAKGGICANSSFSWWGSYLNQCKNKRVFFPYEWMTNVSNVDVYPDDAFVIKCAKEYSLQTL